MSKYSLKDCWFLKQELLSSLKLCLWVIYQIYKFHGYARNFGYTEILCWESIIEFLSSKFHFGFRRRLLFCGPLAFGKEGVFQNISLNLWHDDTVLTFYFIFLQGTEGITDLPIQEAEQCSYLRAMECSPPPLSPPSKVKWMLLVETIETPDGRNHTGELVR